ncbi:SAM-dependent chlorinase/fluorinase [Beggiatoa alba]|nr:SAM-dependent chlorinase/fluorinase [Beggiatoa alba]
MIVLFTDFGEHGPYVGQMKAVLAQQAPAVPIIDLQHDVPCFDVIAAAHLLAAYQGAFPAGSIFLAVVDPGVGSPTCKPVVVKVDGRWFVGPDNGLFEVLAARGNDAQWREISWRPETLSHSFHGRDLFAPVAAGLARGELPAGNIITSHAASISTDDLNNIIYIDYFGNAITGLRAVNLKKAMTLRVGGDSLNHAQTFSEVALGQAFWYQNANGLVEISVNQGHAATLLKLRLGDSVTISSN